MAKKEHVDCKTHVEVLGSVGDFVKKNTGTEYLVDDMYVPQYVNVEKNGYVVKDRVIVKVDPRKMFDGLKASDFSLQNLISIGATNLLNPVAPLSGGMNTMDDLLSRADEIGSIIDANYSDKETIVNSANAVAAAVDNGVSVENNVTE